MLGGIIGEICRWKVITKSSYVLWIGSEAIFEGQSRFYRVKPIGIGSSKVSYGGFYLESVVLNSKVQLGISDIIAAILGNEFL